MDEEIVKWLRTVFAAGRLPAADFASRFGHMDTLFRQTWFVRDLPTGARDMAAEYHAKTLARCKSRKLRDLANEWNVRIDTGLDAPEHEAATPGPAVAPTPGRHSDVASAVPVTAPDSAAVAVPGGAAVPPPAGAASEDADGAAGIGGDRVDMIGLAVSNDVQHAQRAVSPVSNAQVGDDVSTATDPALGREAHAEVSAAAAVEGAAEPAAAAPAQPVGSNSSVMPQPSPACAAESGAASGDLPPPEASPAAAEADRCRNFLRNFQPTSPTNPQHTMHDACHKPEASPQGCARAPAASGSDLSAMQTRLWLLLMALAQASMGAGWASSASSMRLYATSCARGSHDRIAVKQHVCGNPRGLALVRESARTRRVFAALCPPVLCACVAVILWDAQWGAARQETPRALG